MALLYESSVVALHRRPSGSGANVQQHPPPQSRYGPVAGDRKESRNGVATSVRTRRQGGAQVTRVGSRAHQQVQKNVRKGLRDELERRGVHRARSSPLRSTRVPSTRRSRRRAGRHLLRTGAAKSGDSER